MNSTSYHLNPDLVVLGIESSCDDTSAAVLRGNTLLSNVIASQKVHEEYGGVVPELASRAHIQNVVPVVSTALKRAGLSPDDIDVIAYTRGPGLLGSLLVGGSFAKGMSEGTGAPLVDVNHLQGHVLAHFIRMPEEEKEMPAFPFLCLLVSGGNSQIILVKSPLEMEIIGQTIDDAAGEAFDKCSKEMGFGYPGGPVISRLAESGDPDRFHFAKPHVDGYNYSFSGLKTSFMYTLRDEKKKDPDFVEKNKNDLAASLQKTVVKILMEKMRKATEDLGIKEIAVAGGVSANGLLRQAFIDYGREKGLKVYIPPFSFTTDNAAMIAIAGAYRYAAGHTGVLSDTPYTHAYF